MSHSLVLCTQISVQSQCWLLVLWVNISTLSGLGQWNPMISLIVSTITHSLCVSTLCPQRSCDKAWPPTPNFCPVYSNFQSFPLSVDILPTNDWGNKRFSSGNSLSHFPPRCPHPSLRSSLRSWRERYSSCSWPWPVTPGCCSVASLPPPLEPLALNWSRVHQCLDFQYTKVFASLKNFNSTQLYLLSSPHIIK